MKLTALLLLAAVTASAADFSMPAEFGALVSGARLLGQRPQRPSPRMLQAAPSAINTGFLGLGAAGKTGRVKGPGLFGMGDGTYRVVENGPWQIVIAMKTGFVDGTFTIKRDAATGKDTLGFNGTAWDSARGGMGAPANSMDAGQITYNPATDAGQISWMLNGTRQQDAFKGGRAGSRGMSITLSGNNHDFIQD